MQKLSEKKSFALFNYFCRFELFVTNYKQKKKTFLLINLNFRNPRKKMLFKRIEFLEHYMIGAFLVTLPQIEKTGSISKVFIPLEI